MKTYNEMMQIIDTYLDSVIDLEKKTEPDAGDFYEVACNRQELQVALREICDNQYVRTSIQVESTPRTSKKKEIECACNDWGCNLCTSSLTELQGRQGTFG